MDEKTKSILRGESPRKSNMKPVNTRVIATLITLAIVFTGSFNASSQGRALPVPLSDEETNSFPDAKEILRGHIFRTKFDRDVYFLRNIRQEHSEFWPSLLKENIVVKDYVQSPDKLLQFVLELTVVVERTDDSSAITNLMAITSDSAFYANTNAYHPEILRAAGTALAKTGPKARKALADAFNEEHYRTDPVSLSILAETIGKTGISDPYLCGALAATAFTLTTTNGGSYPGCTKDATFNLLSFPDGPSLVRRYLTRTQLFKDPGRFQAIIDGIVAAKPVGLVTNLMELGAIVDEKLGTLPSKPDPYRDDLLDLQVRIKRAIEQLRQARNGVRESCPLVRLAGSRLPNAN
jgi:hypothetical protein